MVKSAYRYWCLSKPVDCRGGCRLAIVSFDLLGCMVAAGYFHSIFLVLSIGFRFNYYESLLLLRAAQQLLIKAGWYDPCMLYGNLFNYFRPIFGARMVPANSNRLKTLKQSNARFLPSLAQLILSVLKIVGQTHRDGRLIVGVLPCWGFGCWCWVWTTAAAVTLSLSWRRHVRLCSPEELRKYLFFFFKVVPTQNVIYSTSVQTLH